MKTQVFEVQLQVTFTLKEDDQPLIPSDVREVLAKMHGRLAIPTQDGITSANITLLPLTIRDLGKT
jgi:hypothetical protein